MWGASKSQGYEEEQNFPPPAHHCWCPLATKGLQFAAEWCRARASAWSSWKSQQAQLQLTCQKLPLPTKVYLTNSSGVTDHLVPVVTTKALVCYQHYVSAYVYLYIYIPLSLSPPICNQSPSIPPCQQKINPQIQPSRTIPNQAFREDQQPLVKSHQLQSNHPSFGKAQPEIPYWPCVPGVSTERESWWKNRDLCWGPKCQVEGDFYGSLLAQQWQEVMMIITFNIFHHMLISRALFKITLRCSSEVDALIWWSHAKLLRFNTASFFLDLVKPKMSLKIIPQHRVYLFNTSTPLKN